MRRYNNIMNSRLTGRLMDRACARWGLLARRLAISSVITLVAPDAAPEDAGDAETGGAADRAAVGPFSFFRTPCVCC